MRRNVSGIGLRLAACNESLQAARWDRRSHVLREVFRVQVNGVHDEVRGHLDERPEVQLVEVAGDVHQQLACFLDPIRRWKVGELASVSRPTASFGGSIERDELGS